VGIAKETPFKMITGDKLMGDKETWDIATEGRRIADSINSERGSASNSSTNAKTRDFNPQPKLWHPCCLVTVDCGTVYNKSI